MALLTRVSRLFRADVHAVLDHIEEPELLLRQALREMEEELDRERQRARMIAHENRQMARRGADIAANIAAIDAGLDVCFAAADEALARTRIRRKLELQQLLECLERKREAREQEQAGLQERIDDHRTRLEHMRQKLELLAEHEPPPEFQADSLAVPPGISDADVEVAFLRERQLRRSS